jgi:hypothetical protein
MPIFLPSSSPFGSKLAPAATRSGRWITETAWVNVRSFKATLLVVVVWGFMSLILGIWFRLSELTACKNYSVEVDAAIALQNGVSHICHQRAAKEWTIDQTTFFTQTNELYLQNAMWMIIATSTTAGFGDKVPSTILGRIVAAMAAIVHPMPAGPTTCVLQRGDCSSVAVTFTTCDSCGGFCSGGNCVDGSDDGHALERAKTLAGGRRGIPVT